LLLLGFALPTWGQDELQLESGFRDKVSVAYILVPVIARSPLGYVQDLAAEDFQLEVDGQPIEFESFEVGSTAPVSVLFLQDLSGSMANADKLRLSRLAIERLLSVAKTSDQFALASFADGSLTLDIPYSNDPDLIDKAMPQWRPYGVTALHDAVSGLPDLTRNRQSSKRAAILITDGADNASELSPSEARLKVRQAELPVYVLGLSTGSPNILDRDGKKLHRYADVLNLLAHLTGGQYFWVSSADEAIGAARTIAADLRHQYVLGFSTSDTGASQYRELTVSTHKKKVRLTFRRGYEGPPPRLPTDLDN
jgi:Ca-activated chloride channel family protein